MVWMDARLPIRFGALDSREDGEAVLTDGASAPPPAASFTPGTHAIGCACCLPRGGAASALAGLFRDRALSAAPPFRGVLAAVGDQAEAEIRIALTADVLVAARFRLAG